MSSNTLYPYGSVTVNIPAGESIAVMTQGEGSASVYQLVGYPQIPSSFELLGNVSNSETLFTSFTNGATLRIDAGVDEVLYEVGSSPSIDTLVSDLVAVSGTQGGAITLTGGTSTTAANAGGAAAVAGGVPGATGVGGAVTITSGVGGSTSGASGVVTISSGTTTAGSGSATGVVTVKSGAGAASAAAVAGGNSGAVTVQSSAGGANTGGATGQAGGAAGLVTISGGAGGNTNSTGAHAGGAGAALAITAGAGGNASAGTGNGGVGGNVTLTPGTGGTSSGGTAGVNGVLRLNGVISRYQPTPTAKTTAVTLTIAELLTGIITGTHSAGATAAYTLPTGTLTDAALQLSVNDSFDWSLINLSAAAVDTITVTAGTDHTIVGNPIVQSSHVSTGGIYGNSSIWRTRKTATNTYVTYRIA
jgi:hypothetical protein